MIGGFFNGILQQEDLTEIRTCIGDGRSEAEEIYKGFDDLWHRNWTTGVEELGEVVKALPGTLKDCTHIGDDIKKLETWGVVFEHPSALPDLVKTNVEHSLIKLTRDLNKAKNEFKDETYFKFGTTVGEMLVIATQPLSAY